MCGRRIFRMSPRARADSRSGNSGDLWRLRRSDQAQAAAGALSSAPGGPAAQTVCHCRRGAPPAGRRVRGRHARRHRRVWRRRCQRPQARRLHAAHQLLPAELRRPRRLCRPEGGARSHRQGKEHRRQAPLLPRHGAGVLCRHRGKPRRAGHGAAGEGCGGW
jgi:peptidoglycan/xylan/chitin deacetylase (PgdA/CDA1 family)